MYDAYKTPLIDTPDRAIERYCKLENVLTLDLYRSVRKPEPALRRVFLALIRYLQNELGRLEQRITHLTPDLNPGGRIQKA
ncbi:MAG: hypothetical protein M0P55_11405 [Clostridiales bacterium]|nr:hypothetical protein [Clostridiales bacterium]